MPKFSSNGYIAVKTVISENTLDVLQINLKFFLVYGPIKK